MGSTQPKSDALRQAWQRKKQDAARPTLLTISEVCDCLRVSRHTIYRLLNERKLPSVRILSRRLIPLSAIEAFIAAQAEGAI
jgi:excisionase family DNA binding protein